VRQKSLPGPPTQSLFLGPVMQMSLLPPPTQRLRREPSE